MRLLLAAILIPMCVAAASAEPLPFTLSVGAGWPHQAQGGIEAPFGAYRQADGDVAIIASAGFPVSVVAGWELALGPRIAASRLQYTEVDDGHIVNIFDYHVVPVDVALALRVARLRFALTPWLGLRAARARFVDTERTLDRAFVTRDVTWAMVGVALGATGEVELFSVGPHRLAAFVDLTEGPRFKLGRDITPYTAGMFATWTFGLAYRI